MQRHNWPGDVCAAAPKRASVRAFLRPERAARRRSLEVRTVHGCLEHVPPQCVCGFLKHLGGWGLSAWVGWVEARVGH